jgi:uncharacterized integral membrane protein (TIGR00698 family)
VRHDKWARSVVHRPDGAGEKSLTMALQQGLAISTPSRIALSAWVRLAAGLGLCVLIAAVAIVAGDFAPIVGAPVFAIAIGVVITNTLRGPLQIGSLRVGEVSKLCLKGGIILLGASLDLGVILRTGAESLPVLLITIATGLACALLLGRTMDVHWRMRCLIGIGTTICGASAIAALAPVVRAKAEEIAYSISVIFFFNMLAVFTFPAIGHLLSLSDPGFGLWAGTAVNDTSAVVAAGFAYSHDAGTIATIVKLTRTTLIIPLVIGFGLLMPWFEAPPAGERDSLAQRVYQAVPVFIILFVVASLLNTLGLMGHYAPTVQLAGRWVMVVALAAVGLQGHWRAFAGAGTRPLLLGLATWVAVGATSLAIQMWTNSL